VAVISCTTSDPPGRIPPSLRGFSRGAAHGTVGWPYGSEQSGEKEKPFARCLLAAMSPVNLLALSCKEEKVP